MLRKDSFKKLSLRQVCGNIQKSECSQFDRIVVIVIVSNQLKDLLTHEFVTEYSLLFVRNQILCKFFDLRKWFLDFVHLGVVQLLDIREDWIFHKQQLMLQRLWHIVEYSHLLCRLYYLS